MNEEDDALEKTREKPLAIYKLLDLFDDLVREAIAEMKTECDNNSDKHKI